MNNSCQPLVSHINRLQGQLERLKKELESKASCSNITHLALSTSKSFDSLRAKIIEGYLENQLLKDIPLPPKKWKEFQELLKIVKA